MTISNYEEAKRLPEIDVLVRISRVTGKSFDWLLTGQEPEGGKKSVRVAQVEELLADADERTVFEFDQFIGVLERVKKATKRRA